MHTRDVGKAHEWVRAVFRPEWFATARALVRRRGRLKKHGGDNGIQPFHRSKPMYGHLHPEAYDATGLVGEGTYETAVG